MASAQRGGGAERYPPGGVVHGLALCRLSTQLERAGACSRGVIHLASLRNHLHCLPGRRRRHPTTDRSLHVAIVPSTALVPIATVDVLVCLAARWISVYLSVNALYVTGARQCTTCAGLYVSTYDQMGFRKIKQNP